MIDLIIRLVVQEQFRAEQYEVSVGYRKYSLFDPGSPGW